MIREQLPTGEYEWICIDHDIVVEDLTEVFEVEEIGTILVEDE
jgi:hypothetical protein